MKTNIFAEWVGNFIQVLISLFVILVLSAIIAWPFGLLCNVVRKFFLYGFLYEFSLWT